MVVSLSIDASVSLEKRQMPSSGFGCARSGIASSLSLFLLFHSILSERERRCGRSQKKKESGR